MVGMRRFMVSAVMIVALAVLLARRNIIFALPQPANVPAATSYPLASVELSLERTPCFGPCPVYNLTVGGDGVVTYEGIQFVESLGGRRATIAVNQVVLLVNEFLRVRFFDALSTYAGRELVLLQGQSLLR